MLKDDYVTESESLALLVSDKYEALAKNLEKQTEAINKLVDLQEQQMHQNKQMYQNQLIHQNQLIQTCSFRL